MERSNLQLSTGMCLLVGEVCCEQLMRLCIARCLPNLSRCFNVLAGACEDLKVESLGVPVLCSIFILSNGQFFNSFKFLIIKISFLISV